MNDTITVRLDVRELGLPDINYRNKRIVTPHTITLVYLVDDPEPVNGIHPVKVEVAGPCRGARPGSHGITRTCEWFYRTYPELWPDWLIAFGAEHRP